MNKKILSGTVFGLILGLGLGVATPMIGAPNTNKAKDIVIKKSSKKPVVSTPVVAENTPEADKDNSMKEVVVLLKEINETLKGNSEQNKQILSALKTLVSQSDVNPVTGQKK